MEVSMSIFCPRACHSRRPRARQLALAVSCAVLVCGLPSVLPAEEGPPPWDAPFAGTAEDILTAAQALDAPEDADIHVLLRERIHRFDAQGVGQSTLRSVFHVITPVGAEGWASLWTSWRPWHQQRPEIRARVITRHGAVHLLDPATIAESPVGEDSDDVLSDRLQLQAPLPAIAVGAVVEQEITIRDDAPFFAAGMTYGFGFALRVPVHASRLVVDAPESLALGHALYSLDELEPQRQVTDGRIRLLFEAGPFEAVEKIEPYAPGQLVQWPLVRYATGESWAAIAQSYSAQVDARLAGIDLRPTVSALLTGAAKDRPARVARLLAWLHAEVRYTGLEFGESAIVPYSPTEVLERKYGDCKDKATLLVALLRTADIPAHVALLSTSPGVDTDPALAGLGVFDHAIVFIPAEGDDAELWIDATAEHAAVGELPVVDQGRMALIAAEGTTELVTTPVAEPAANRSFERREIFLPSELRGGRVVEVTQVSGAISQRLRRTYSLYEDSEIEEWLESYVASTYGAEELLAWEVTDPADPLHAV